ncbi:unnamed protein product [Paramecium primaurelia]|uniref:Protein kinase domain-containing protein n=1 Tax=Paramecium primaurelia TaxID=5886 RepID=A0A8S1MIA7_PARPR|nr:unnamed protein product [Paramecium primaurelia]
MNQQNSKNNHNFLDTTIRTPLNKQLKIINLLREGNDETLYKAQSIQNQNSCPIEFILKSYQTMKESEKDFIQKLIYTQKQSDTGIVTIFELFEQQQNYLVIMEMGTINLHDYIKNQSSLTIEKKIEICNHLFTPIKFMHSEKFYHKNLKPESFVLIENRFKLIDFGLMMKGYDQNNSHTQHVGKTIYSAPEIIFQTYECSEKVDSWALGCIIYEILSGESFFLRNETVEDLKCQLYQYQQKQDSYLKKIDQLQISEQIQRTLKQMLDPNPQKRISILEALEAFINKQSKTQMNPVFQTQTNQVFQTQTNPVFQTQTNPVLQTQQTYQQSNKTQQQPTQSLASPFQQQTTQKQQLSQTNIQQVFNQLLGEIKQQISKNQNQKIENKDAKKQIRENESKQSQNDVENASHQINKIIHNLKKNVQEKQVQQIQEINKQYELKLEDKDKVIDELKKQLVDKQREIEQQIKSNNELVQESKKLQEQINNFNCKSQEQETQIKQQQALIQKQETQILEQETQIQQQETQIQEQQNLNYLVNQVINIIQSRKQEQCQNNQQQQQQNNEEETLFQKLFDELSQICKRF